MDGAYTLVANSMNGKRALFEKRVVYLAPWRDRAPQLLVATNGHPAMNVIGADFSDESRDGHLTALAQWIDSE